MPLNCGGKNNSYAMLKRARKACGFKFARLSNFLSFSWYTQGITCRLVTIETTLRQVTATGFKVSCERRFVSNTAFSELTPFPLG